VLAETKHNYQLPLQQSSQLRLCTTTSQLAAHSQPTFSMACTKRQMAPLPNPWSVLHAQHINSAMHCSKGNAPETLPGVITL
jgi:hypothetical protein